MMLNSVVEPSLWFYFLGGVLTLILVDLFFLNKRGHEIKLKEALYTSAFWIALALAFNLWFATQYGTELGLQFLTGYLVEESLSVDNLFVILLVFKAFRIPPHLQHRVLFWGILGAIVMRGILIVVGAKLINEFSWIMYIFGGILIVSAIKFLFESDSQTDVTGHWSVNLLRKFFPITKDLRGQNFFVREDNVLKITPLFIALIVVEISDLVFAVDSIPAVFAVTKDSFVAFASNILAVLGLRALYFVIADMVSKFRYLKPGLAVVLGFVGVKMLIVDLYHIPSWVSLLVIISVLLTAGLSSWYVNKRSVLKS